MELLFVKTEMRKGYSGARGGKTNDLIRLYVKAEANKLSYPAFALAEERVKGKCCEWQRRSWAQCLHGGS